MQVVTIHVSVSQLKTAERCLRKWAMRYIDKRPEPQTAQQAQGIDGHGRVERLLKTATHPGTDAIGKLVEQAMLDGHLPTPMRPDIVIETNFKLPLGDDVEFIGLADILVPPAAPEWTAEVVDHKFTSNSSYAMTKEQLRDDPQAIGYSKIAALYWPQSLRVRNRWNYYDYRAKRLHPVVIERDLVEVEERFLAKVFHPAHRLAALKRHPGVKAADLPGDESMQACFDYKGCPHADICEIGKRSRTIGKNAWSADKSFTTNVAFSSEPKPSPTASGDGAKEKMLSLEQQLDNIRAMKAGGAAPVQATSQQPPMAPAAPQVQSHFAPPQQPIAPVAAPAAPVAPTFNPTPVYPPGAAPAPIYPPMNAVAPPAPSPFNPALAAAQSTYGAVGINPAPVAAGIGAPVMPTQTAPVFAPPAVQVGVPAQPTLTAQPVFAPQQAPVAAVAVPVAAPTPGVVMPAQGADDKAKKGAKSKGKKITVYCNAVPIKSDDEPVQLIEILGPAMRKIADEKGVPHWGLIPYDSKARLALAFDAWLSESQWKGTILTDFNSLESQAVIEVLRNRADVFVQGLAS